MIAQSRTNEHRIDFVQNQFLTMLPQIRRQASIAFCGLGAETREELLQEVIANAYCAFAQFVRRGKQAVAYPTPLAEFAIRQVRAGRRVGCRMNVRDILSSQLSRTHQLTIQRLNQCDRRTGLWTELLVEDRQAGPAEIAARAPRLLRLVPKAFRAQSPNCPGSGPWRADCRHRASIQPESWAGQPAAQLVSDKLGTVSKW